MTATTSTTFTVQGMTCAHCVAAVSDEIAKVPDVTAVEVDLDSGSVTVESSAPVALDALAAAVDEAGYVLAGPEASG